MVCRSCEKIKKNDEFPWRIKGEKRQYQCKDCYRQYHRNHYKNNKQQYKVNNQKRRERQQRKVFNYLQNKKCLDCGERNIIVLEFDHLRKRFMGVGEMAQGGYSWKKILEEIKKCDIVCANCHKIRTYQRIGAKKIEWNDTREV